MKIKPAHLVAPHRCGEEIPQQVACYALFPGVYELFSKAGFDKIPAFRRY